MDVLGGGTTPTISKLGERELIINIFELPPPLSSLLWFNISFGQSGSVSVSIGQIWSVLVSLGQI